MAFERTEYTIEESDGFTVAGVAQRGEDVDPGELWDALDEFEDDLRDTTVAQDVYGVLFEFDEGSDEVTYLVGRQVDSTDDLPAELTGVEIPEASYAVFSLNDVDPLELTEMVNEMNEQFFSDTEHERIEGPVFQRYDTTDEPYGSHSSFELFVPVDDD